MGTVILEVTQEVKAREVLEVTVLVRVVVEAALEARLYIQGQYHDQDHPQNANTLPIENLTPFRAHVPFLGLD